MVVGQYGYRYGPALECGGQGVAVCRVPAGGVPIEAKNGDARMQGDYSGELGRRQLPAGLGERAELLRLAGADGGDGDGHGVEGSFDDHDLAVSARNCGRSLRFLRLVTHAAGALSLALAEAAGAAPGLEGRPPEQGLARAGSARRLLRPALARTVGRCSRCASRQGGCGGRRGGVHHLGEYHRGGLRSQHRGRDHHAGCFAGDQLVEALPVACRPRLALTAAWEVRHTGSSIPVIA